MCWIDNESQLQEDEQLARALQESLNVEPPTYGNGNRNGFGNGNGNGNVNISVYGNGNGNGMGNGSVNTYQPVPGYYPMGYRYGIFTQTGLNKKKSHKK